MKNFNIKLWFKRFRHAFKKIGSDADKDWKILLSLFIIAFLVSVFIHTQMFFEVQSISSESDNQVIYNNNSSDSNALGDVLNKYDKREKEYNHIASTTVVTFDPN